MTIPKWVTYTTANGLANNVVRAIAIDAQNNIWVGTSEGVTKISDITNDLATITNIFSINLYPNPVQNVLNINLPGKTGILQIIDISGICVIQKPVAENNLSFDVSGLSNGIYIVKIISENQIFTEKIVKSGQRSK